MSPTPGPAPGPSRRSVLRLGSVGVAGTVGAAALGVAAPMRPAVAASSVATPLTGARAAGAAPADGDTLVVISLRGGADGLSIVPPIGDDAYPRLRPTIAVPAAGAHRIDDTFRLHPALAPVLPLWDAGRLAAVHATGLPGATRSHAVATATVEAAGGAGGWIDRAIGAIGAVEPLAGVQVGRPELPTALAGPHPAFALAGLAATASVVPDTLVTAQGWQAALGRLGGTTVPLVAALAGGARLTKVAAAPAAATGYPPTPLGRALHDVARLVRAGVGLRVATVDDDGWDLHEGAGTTERGPQTDRIAALAQALLAFATELGPDLDRVVVVTLSEFGRRVDENGSGGTDHGTGGVMLLLGGGVNGGKVHGRWPGLAPAAKGSADDGALPVTTDARQVLAEILTRRCGLTSTGAVFPALPPTPTPLNLTTPTSP